ncbi:hypothetical protein QJS83_03540 [Bdellovibrio sp. 22V]|uniref:hypothetical protein n=1 Tax=Bdellovibrio TaxID=958 RepID=UPI002542DDEF|nr:hypothetical protein [Bdellovibrio sp. 22V]WII72943.1 hypothetical protein QJS83_03540 [Bdellovibrio sp. 22V]
MKTFDKYSSILMLPEEKERSVSLPVFTEIKKGETSESTFDEDEILTDKDQTARTTITNAVKRMKLNDIAPEPLEDLPGDFMRGDIDVREQMDRAADAMDTSWRGLQNRADEDSPRGELGASFRDTPGGLEEVEAKTDEYIATHRLKKVKARPQKRVG